jgi:hypothetical protein
MRAQQFVELIPFFLFLPKFSLRQERSKAARKRGLLPTIHTVNEWKEKKKKRKVREDLEILINNADSHEDTRARANGAHEVRKDRQETNTETTKGCGSRNVAIKLLQHRILTMAADYHLLIFELLSDIARGTA